MTQVSIIILSFNTKNHLITCLSSLFAQYKKEIEEKIIEIIVVDNASSDRSALAVKEMIQKNHLITLIAHDENVGFSQGVMLGVTKAKGSFLFFLNSDTVIKDHGLLAMISYVSGHKDVAIAGAKLYNKDGSIQASVGKFYTPLNVFLMLIGGERIGLLRQSPKKLQVVDWVSGAAMLVKKEVFDGIDGFDRGYFMYIEDMDLSYRAKQRGYQTIFFPEFSIVHASHGSASREFAIVHIYQGLLYFYKKQRSMGEFYLVKGMLLAKATIAIGFGLLFFKKQLIKTYKKAIQTLL